MEKHIFECTTDLDVDSFQFEIKWNVNKAIFQRLEQEIGEQLSSTFSTTFYNSSWYIKIKTTKEYPDHFSIYLIRKKADTSLILSYDIIVKNGEKLLDLFNRTATNLNIPATGTNWGWSQWAKKVDLMSESNWTSDFLTVICKVKIKKENEIVTSEKIYWNSKSDVETLTKDLESLVESGLYSDITLSVGDKKFKAHKNILAARCQYFATMFSSDFKEAKEPEITIKDIEVEDFESILQYIYSGKFVMGSREKIPKLLMAADRFSLTSFAAECEKYLEQNITVDNCLELYEVADLCSCNNLKGKVKAFMKTNIDQIMLTDSWKKLKTENSSLLIKIFESVFQK